MRNDNIILRGRATPTGPIPDTTPVGAPIAPQDAADTFPTHIASRGKGGLRTVIDIAARDAIAVECREVGMQVYTETEGIYWKLGSDLSSWTDMFGASQDWNIGPKIVQHRRLTKAENATYTGPNGEIVVISDDNATLRVHDGATAGGKLPSPASLGFSSLAALKANTFPAVTGTIATTAGFATPGDGGSNRFYLTADTSGTDNNGSVVKDALNRWWKQISTIYDIKQWGADPTGVVDAKTIIQNVINAAVNVTGLLEALEERRDNVVTPVDEVTPAAVNAPTHIVYLSPGTYRTTGMLAVKDGTWIVGEGRNSILKGDFAVAGAGVIGNITGQVGFVKLQNFSILTDRTEASTVGLYCKAISDSEFTNLQILRTSPTQGFAAAVQLRAVTAGEGSYRNRFEHCRFEVRGGSTTFGIYGDGLTGNIKGPNGTVFDNCYFYGGDDATPGTATDSTVAVQLHHVEGGVLLIGCIFEGAFGLGVDIGSTSIGCAVIGNRFTITGGGTAKRGIRINGAGHTVMANNLSSIVSVTERLEIVGIGNHAVLGAESGLAGGTLQRIVGNLSTGLIPTNPVGNAGGLNTFNSIFNTAATQGAAQATEKVGLIVRHVDGVTNRGGLFYFDGTAAALIIGTIVATGAAQPIKLLVGVDTALSVDANLTAGETRLSVGEGATLRRVSIGATDSAGSGFRQLRIPNGP